MCCVREPTGVVHAACRRPATLDHPRQGSEVPDAEIGDGDTGRASSSAPSADSHRPSAHYRSLMHVFLFTETFPFPGGDDPFLGEEVKALAASGGLTIVPTVRLAGPMRPLPAGTIVDDRLAVQLPRGGFRWRDLVGAACSSIAWRDIARHAPRSLQARPFATVIVRRARALHVERWVRRNLARTMPQGSIAYCWWSAAYATGVARAGRRRGIPIVTRAHGFDLFAQQDAIGFIPLQSELIARTDVTLSVSEAGARYLRDLFPHAAIEVSRIGVPDPGYRARPSADGILRIVTCSSVVPVKRVDLLVDALSLLARQTPSIAFQWTHLGGGSGLAALRARIDTDSLLKDRVRLLGALDHEDVLAHYANERVDLVVNVSASEGVPVSLMEAASAAIPILATAVGGSAEIAGPAGGMLLPEDATPREIADAIRTFAELPEASREHLRQQARQAWQSDFASPEVYHRLVRRLGSIAEPRLSGERVICTRCVMDSVSNNISFDENGRCNFCTEFLERAGTQLFLSAGQRQQAFDELLVEVRHAAQGKPYDCIIGVSGGVDSSWTLVQAVRAGLRPLAVHMDNGWNTELAQNNIANLVKGLDVDLVTYVINWNEYRELMIAFLDADVIDIELLYDNAMLAVNYQQAARFGIRHILAGTNLATEGMRIPSSWNWLKYDKRNIAALRRAHDHGSLESFPAIGTRDYIWNLMVRRIRWVSFLDYVDYKKADAIEELTRDFDYKPYPHKHYESVFTRLYMGYILPVKFGVDMRKVDFSNLIVSGQMTRDEALARLAEPAYPSEQDLEQDIAFFRKKVGWSPQEWDDYLRRPRREHRAYASEVEWYARARTLGRLLGRAPSGSSASTPSSTGQRAGER